MFLLYNQLRIKTVDRILFPREKIGQGDFKIYYQTNPFLKLNINTKVFNEKVQDGLRRWIDPAWTQDTYLLEYNKPGFIEPVTGWAISDKHHLIYPSLGFSGAPYVRKPSILSVYSKHHGAIHADQIISLRDTGEENYFHFFNDIIPKLLLLRDQGIVFDNYHIVVSEKLYRKDYFKAITENSWMKELRWLVQETEWVAFNRAIFCKPLTNTGEYLREMVSVVRPEINTDKSRRVFITRNNRSLRFIENMEQLSPILQKLDFEIIDPSELTFKEQIEIFSTCIYIAGIHGAGLTNMIFRAGQPLAVLEIAHPFAYIPFHYIMLATEFGFSYNILTGTHGPLAGTGGFSVDPVTFELALRKMTGKMV